MSVTEDRPKVVVPIFIRKTDGGVDLIGSGVLLRTFENDLLITAAHVLAKAKRGTLCVPIGGRDYYALTQPFTISSRTLEDADNETNPDLGYMIVTRGFRDHLASAGWSFLVTCSSSLAVDVASFSDQISAVEGFPRSENEQGPHPVSALIFFPFFSDRSLFRFGYDNRKFLGIRFQHIIRNVGEPVITLWPECMSGGPIWVVEGERLKLAGIVAQYYASRSLLLGTRIDLLLTHLNSVGIDTSDPGAL